MSEQRNWKSTVFVTLTYDEEHLKSSSLIPRDLTLFLKRLRKDLALEGRKIKYYACGEYGEFVKDENTGNISKNGRPHFHLIIFGMDTSKHDRKLLVDNWPYCNPVKFMDGRTRGCVMANKDTIQYVAGYVQKKLYGKDSEFYEQLNLVPPFSRQSQGLGVEYFKNHRYLVDEEDTTIKLWNGQKMVLPRYLRDKLGIEFDTQKLDQKMADDVLKKNPWIDRHDWLLILRRNLVYEFYQILERPNAKNELEAFYVKHKIRRH